MRIVTSELGFGIASESTDIVACRSDGSPAQEFLIYNMDLVYSDSGADDRLLCQSNLPGLACPGSAAIAGTSVQKSAVKVERSDLDPASDRSDNEVQRSRWNTRGWTYQEGLLARRRLVFTGSQCYFQCGAMCRVESISVPQDYGVDLPNLSSVFPRQDPGDQRPWQPRRLVGFQA